MNKTTSILLVLAILAVVGFFVFKKNSSPEVNPYTNGTSAPLESTNPIPAGAKMETGELPANSPKAYTLAEVSTHNNAASCWSAVNGGVYDLTSWISQHPGGKQAILSICGKDGSAAFNGQHGGQARPASELAGFKIGELSR